MGISVLTPRHRIGFRRTAVAVVVTLVAAIPASFSGSAAAAGPVSQATGDFLSGSVGGTDLAALIALQGASAQNFGVPATVQEAKGLDVTAVSAINVSTGTVNLLGTNPILALGAANQYAGANNDGSSFGASGAVTDTGAVSVGTGTQQGSATLDLTAILPVAGLLTSASVTVGALAATATETTAFAQSGNYQIAGLTVNAASPAVTALGTVLAALIAANCAAPPCPVTLTAPGVTLDLVAGTIALDLNTLIPGLDGGLPVGTALLPLLTAALATALATPVLTVNGVVVVVAPAVVAAALAAALTALVTALDTALTGVMALTVNNQATVAGTFTETALRVNLLAAAVTIATVVNLASASVGPNAGPAPPTALTIDPNSGPTAGGQTVTITGTNFIPGATTVTIGGNTVPATVDPSGASLTFITPAHAAVPVPVTVTRVTP